MIVGTGGVGGGGLRRHEGGCPFLPPVFGRGDSVAGVKRREGGIQAVLGDCPPAVYGLLEEDGRRGDAEDDAFISLFSPTLRKLLDRFENEAESWKVDVRASYIPRRGYRRTFMHTY